MSSGSSLSHSENLLPMIDYALKTAGICAGDINLFAAANGPGSFTGIRIGVSTARALAQTLGIPVIKVPTLETFVYLLPDENTNNHCLNVVCPVFDARRGQMYAGAYYLEKDKRIMTLVKGGAYDPGEYFEALKASLKAFGKLAKHAYGDEALIICRLMGDGLSEFAGQINAFQEQIPESGINVISGNRGGCEIICQDAKAVLAWALSNGKTINYENLKPVYMRKAEAQRRLDEKKDRLDPGQPATYSAADYIRTATEKDAYGISVVERLSFGEPWLERSILDDIRLGYSDYVVFESDGLILGYAGLHRILEEGHITNIAVHPSMRKKGIGKALLGELMRVAAEKGVTEFTLEVRESDEAAIKFYEEHGYVTEGKRKDYYPKEKGEREDALIMWRRSDAR